MTIKCLCLRNFRNYKEAFIPFSPKINLIFGHNAQGKTNLLEALYLLITGRSFRTSHLHELIKFGEDFFYIEALFEKNGIEQSLKFYFNGKERKILHNLTSLTSLSALLGILNGVILSPEDRSLIKGGPQSRRQFLDLLIAQANPLYLHHLSRYLKAMKQRNWLLKKRSLTTLSIWEEQMAASAIYLTQKRVQTVAELGKICSSETLGTDQLELNYSSQASSVIADGEEAIGLFFLKQFEKLRSRECDLGSTLSGPHRDDLSILLQGKEAKQFASEGQQRSCIASLKLSQWQWLSNLNDSSPILCIDDLGVSFDPLRESELYQRIQELGQVFITTARPSPLSCHHIHVNNGILC